MEGLTFPNPGGGFFDFAPVEDVGGGLLLDLELAVQLLLLPLLSTTGLQRFKKMNYMFPSENCIFRLT